MNSAWWEGKKGEWYVVAQFVLFGILFLFFDVKSHREEKWLASKYADYGHYQKRTRKLIPFLY